MAEQIELPEGWWLEWGGQYENLQRASNRLMILVPAALLLILVLLYNTFSSTRMALLIFGNVLLGASGGIFALLVRGLTFSITAGVGFITLFGVSVLNGVVLVSEINRLREAGRDVDEAIASASRDRLRPILMASFVALFGFIPMALSHSSGAEVQRPLATVVIGGLLTSMPFTLYVIPILYRWIAPKNGDSAPTGGLDAISGPFINCPLFPIGCAVKFESRRHHSKYTPMSITHSRMASATRNWELAIGMGLILSGWRADCRHLCDLIRNSTSADRR
jgi:predicted RND superfamily exporter protein